MSSQKDRIKELLGSGLNNEVVATAVGVDPSYISQLMTDQNFVEEVTALRVQSLTSATQRDRSWDSLENKLLATLHEKVDQNMLYKVPDIVRVLAIANQAKRRGATAPEALTQSKPVVSLVIPTVVINNYTKTAQGEVVEVETAEGEKQTLLTMPAVTLMQKLTSAGTPGIDYDKVRRYLPSSSKAENIKG